MYKLPDSGANVAIHVICTSYPVQASSLLPAIFIEVFTVTFLAEWGDRSQIVTIGMSRSENVTVTLPFDVCHPPTPTQPPTYTRRVGY